MMSLNTRFKAAMLAVVMLTASHVGTVSASWFTPKKVAAGIFVAMWVRLRTKGSTNWDYKMSDWKADLKALMEEHNIFDVELYKQLVALFDKYVIGRQVSIIDTVRREKNEDGSITSYKRKKCDAKPFGVIGLIDAYVIMQLEKIGEIGKNWDSAGNFFAKFDDSVTIVGDNNSVTITKN